MTRPQRLQHHCRVAEALVLLALAKALVRFVPLRMWRGTLGHISPASAYVAVAAPPELAQSRIGMAVDRAAMRAPFTTVCLPRAIACQWMLSHRRLAAKLVFSAAHGALRNGSINDLHAHVECQEGVIIGLLDQPLKPVLSLTNRVLASPK